MASPAKTFTICLVTAALSLSGHAQGPRQLWVDYQVDYPFANVYLFEVVGGYQTILSQSDRWRSFSLTPTFEYAGLRRFDFTFDLPMGYTFQADTVNSVEINPILGTRAHITQNKRIDTRFLLRLEHRFFKTIDGSWDHSDRVRLKVEAFIAINGPNMYGNKRWNGIVDYEEFLVVDDQVGERFANRRRFRAGIGYRYDYRNRFEIIFSRQSTRNGIDDTFNPDNNVIHVKYKMFLNPARVSAPR